MTPKRISSAIVLIVATILAIYRAMHAPPVSSRSNSGSTHHATSASHPRASTATESATSEQPSAPSSEKPPQAPAAPASHFYAGRPVFSAETLTFLENVGYVTGYSESKQQPLWTCYHLKGEPAYKGLHRPDGIKFQVDDRTRARVDSRAYTNSGYDRGHNAPSDAIGAFFGEVAQRQTFLMSNVCPQKHDLNAGDWNGLEQAEQFIYRRQYNEVWIVTGPLFEGQPGSMGTIGREQIPVPTSFYKILVVEEKGKGQAGVKMLAVIMPQAAQGAHALRTYTVTVDTVEKRSGIDFFAELPGDIQARVESATPDASWNLDLILDPESIRSHR